MKRKAKSDANSLTSPSLKASEFYAQLDKLNVKNGKLLIENEQDVDLVLKMLADYYKRGEVSGKAYGTFAGKQIVTT